MEAYTDFATVYDRFMEEIPYTDWLTFLEMVFKKEQIQPNVIADLGCGTGNMLLPLAKKGYCMIGVDLSFDMLCQADQKLRQANCTAVLLEQDLTEFVLPQKADCIVSVCDSLNYLTEDSMLAEAFACVKAQLQPNGLFLFDMNTEYKFREVLAQNIFAATEENAAYIWENFYDEIEKINEYAVNFFIKNKDGSYNRTEEFHYERAYAIEEVKQALEQNGLRLCAMYDDYKYVEAHERSERIVFLAKHI